MSESPHASDLAIVGHGIDLCEAHRMLELLERHGTRALERLFTAEEQAYAAPAGEPNGERLAARFAAKEAILKALGTGLRGGILWTDVEVVRDANGRPGVRLAGEAAVVAERLGIVAWHLSLSHAAGMAMASVIACGWRPCPDSMR